MNFLKNCFNRVIGWIAKPLTWLIEKNTACFAPLTMLFRGHNVSLTWKNVGRVALGLFYTFLALLVVGASVVLSITGLTLVLGLVLPMLLANLLAVLATVYIAYRVYVAAELDLAEIITAHVDLEVEA